MKLITIQSTIEVLLGLLDDEGDVIQQVPIQVPIPKLDEKTLAAVLQQVKAKKAEIESKIPAEEGSKKGEAKADQ